MRKLITLSDSQNELIERVKRELYQETLTGVLVALALFYEQNKRKAQGRPRGSSVNEEPQEDDDVEMYQNPDPHTTSPYSYNDLVAWYEAHGQQMPAREDLIIHKDYNPKG